MQRNHFTTKNTLLLNEAICSTLFVSHTKQRTFEKTIIFDSLDLICEAYQMLAFIFEFYPEVNEDVSVWTLAT